MSNPSDIDHTPLTFGKYVGKTPNEIAEIDERYICWMFREVKNRPTCSELLYKACGCGSLPATSSTTKKPENNMHVKNNFDSYDDDIPF